MVDRVKGERQFDALEQKWTLVFDINAICALEEAKDKPFMQAVQDMFPLLQDVDLDDETAMAEASKNIRFGDLRELFSLGLDAHHPDIDIKDVGDIMQEIGIPQAVPLLMGSIMACMAEGGDDAPKNPPKARSRTRG